ncbi:hypothetical protein BC940DRAFT_322233 [Gongronella butleri]|nr:hypothetical protein BC940DRAFT_322233 [Gongronella butleri]
MFWKSQQFELKDIPDLSGKTVVITGANTGIGRACAREMARRGCSIVLACRSEEKTQPVVDEIKATTGNDNVTFMRLDLMSLASVKSFADEFKSKHTQLHILINNAGIMGTDFGLSTDGIEQQFATNHVAHMYLTLLLLPLLEATAPSRIVNVSSDGQRWADKWDLANVSNEEGYGRWNQYFLTKAANILFTRELAKRLKDKKVMCNACHPGIVDTDLLRYNVDYGTFFFKIARFVVRFVLRPMSPTEGALTQLYLATSADVDEKQIQGQFYEPIAQPAKPARVASSDEYAVELWDFTEALLAEKVPGYVKSSL